MCLWCTAVAHLTRLPARYSLAAPRVVALTAAAVHRHAPPGRDAVPTRSALRSGSSVSSFGDSEEDPSAHGALLEDFTSERCLFLQRLCFGIHDCMYDRLQAAAQSLSA